MAHPEQRDFIIRVKEKYPEFFKGKKVLDIGSLDINGSARDFFEDCDYTGIDVGEGKGVDVVCPGEEWNAPDQTYDVVLSAECFEHNPNWLETFKNMIRMCKPGGLVFFTCATHGREEHGTTRTTPEDSPLTPDRDYYRNLDEDNFTSEIAFKDYFDTYEFDSRTEYPQDLYFYGIRSNVKDFQKYVYLNFMKDHWRDLIMMVEDNYSEHIGEDDCLIVGACTERSVEEIKKFNPGAKRYIVYQLEPLHKNHWHSPDKIINHIKGADEIWDYDSDNINFLSDYGIEAEYKPFLYSEKLKRIENKPDDELDIDILFYGDHTCPYRLQTLREIFSPHVGVKEEGVVMLWNVSGKKLDDYISRAKVILDLHTSEENKVQKQTRLFYALINGKCVVSEKSKYNGFKDLIIEVERDQLKDKLFQVLREGQWKEQQKNVSERFKELSTTVERNMNGIITKHSRQTPKFYTDKTTLHSYGEIYDRILEPFADKEGSMLEIGVYNGGSMLVWQDYFSKMKIYGLDINDNVPKVVLNKFNQDRIDYQLLDAYSEKAFEYLMSKNPDGFDIIIDDGPHDEEFKLLGLDMYLRSIKKGGLYVIEDILSVETIPKLVDKVHSIFDPEYGTNYRISLHDHRGTDRKRYDDFMMVVEV